MDEERKVMLLKKRKRKIIFCIILTTVLFLPLILQLLHNLSVISFSPTEFIKSAGFSSVDVKSEFVSFHDVGQGDCTVIKSGNRTAVIDFGKRDDADFLYRDLKKMGIGRIDLAIVTHCHEDHLGGIKRLCESMPIDVAVISKETAQDYDEDYYNEAVSALKSVNCEILNPEAGTVFSLGDAEIEIIFANYPAKNENDRSTILKIKIGGKTVLITGDCSQDEEKEILKSNIDIKANILKVGHHGSNSSCSDEFLKAVEPQVAVISCGYDNIYSHPSDELLERLKNHKINIYRTDLDGDVNITFKGKKFYVGVERKAA